LDEPDDLRPARWSLGRPERRIRRARFHVMIPVGVLARPSDPGITAPHVGSPGEVRSASTRVDAGLLRS